MQLLLWSFKSFFHSKRKPWIPPHSSATLSSPWKPRRLSVYGLTYCVIFHIMEPYNRCLSGSGFFPFPAAASHATVVMSVAGDRMASVHGVLMFVWMERLMYSSERWMKYFCWCCSSSDRMGCFTWSRQQARRAGPTCRHLTRLCLCHVCSTITGQCQSKANLHSSIGEKNLSSVAAQCPVTMYPGKWRLYIHFVVNHVCVWRAI